MIISKTPFRVSFFGGGTDYPDYIKEHGGSVLSSAIDKYAYISCRKLPPFFEHKHRIVYSKIEEVINNNDIKHPAGKSILNYLNINEGLEIHYDGDLPARSGIGSSSSFTVGLLHVLFKYLNLEISEKELAKKAIYVEQSVIKETVGCQDQIAASFGGLNHINFLKNGEFEVVPIQIENDRLENLENNLFIVFSGISRYASEAAKAKVKNLEKVKVQLKEMKKFVFEGINILENKSKSLDDFGELLNESWILKKGLSEKITNPKIDNLYSIAMEAGASGGKLLGAGGGGFLLFYVNKKYQKDFIESVSSSTAVPIKVDREGSKIILEENK